MKTNPRRLALLSSVTAIVLAAGGMVGAAAMEIAGPRTDAQAEPQAVAEKMPGAPYLYLGWGDPQSATSVMSETGVSAFTMAFMLSSGGCTPAWDGQRPLTGGTDEQTIDAIKAAGGQVQISFGGYSGNKLGPNCSSPEAFAGAVQQVIDAHGPDVVDFDIENTDEYEDYAVQDRILQGIAIVTTAFTSGLFSLTIAIPCRMRSCTA